MKVLWLSWKDKYHPQAGGAELVTSELLGRLVKDGHEVILVTSSYDGAKPKATIDGYQVVRLGGRVSVYWRAYRYVRRQLRDWPDLVVEEINTLPFGSQLYLPHTERRLFFHMLCRQIWFYQLPWPASLIGYVIEPIYLRLMNRQSAIAMSDSTKQDLLRYGFRFQNVNVISEGFQSKPVGDLDSVVKFAQPTMLSLGSFRPMKRTLDQIAAFELAKPELPSLRLKVAGDSNGFYGQKVLAAIANSPYKADIEYLGRISETAKYRLIRRSHLIAVTSIKEGWGLIVTEAASQGTPAVVYDVDGLRDSVRNGQTGAVCRQNTPADLATNIVALLADPARYRLLQNNGWRWSHDINFDTSYRQFKQEVNL